MVIRSPQEIDEELAQVRRRATEVEAALAAADERLPRLEAEEAETAAALREAQDTFVARAGELHALLRRGMAAGEPAAVAGAERRDEAQEAYEAARRVAAPRQVALSTARR